MEVFQRRPAMTGANSSAFRGGESPTVVWSAGGISVLRRRMGDGQRRNDGNFTSEASRPSGGASMGREEQNDSDVRRRRISDDDNIRFAGPEGNASKGRRGLGENRREASKSKKSALHRKGLRLFLLSLLIFLALVFLVYKLLFVVSDVTVDGAGMYSQEEIIAASGIGNGVNLYSFRSSTVKNRITFSCPYVSDVDITRKIPNNIIISVREDKASYVAEIYGDDILLSDSLRVLGILGGEDAVPDGAVRLKLPEVKQALSGRMLVFCEDRSEKLTRTLVSAISESELDGRIVSVDLKSPYDISLVCDGKYLLIIGDTSDLALKLKTAARVLEDEMFDGNNKMRIDLQTPGKTSVIIDNELVFD